MNSFTCTGSKNEIDEKAAWNFVQYGVLSVPFISFEKQIKRESFNLKELPSIAQHTLEKEMGITVGCRRAIMFSGGFDSMLVAVLAKHLKAKVEGVTVKFDQFNSLTVAGAVESARKLGINHYIIDVNSEDFLSAFDTICSILDEPLLDLDLVVVCAALKKYDSELAGNSFIGGMGSDQWFGNATRQGSKELATQLNWSMKNEMAHHKVANTFDIKFVFPFLSKSMVELSQLIPSDLKQDKRLLRSLPISHLIPFRDTQREMQVPFIMRQMLLKAFGEKAWPSPVLLKNLTNKEFDRALRQVFLGLWLKKRKIEVKGR